MENNKIYEDIALRTDGDIYLGVVGPVRTGKSTFIKRFMDVLVIPRIENVYMKERAKDELPQSGSGKTIMTAEPKFVPEEAVNISVGGGADISVRLIDCVGYMVDGAIGQQEGGAERMVTTPWFDKEVTMKEAAELGTRKVIAEHSTIGIVVTTDGSVTEIPRESYTDAEARVIGELQAIGKPFVVLLNSAHPNDSATQELRTSIAEKYGVTCISANCMTLEEEDIVGILRSVLFEFPVSEMGVFLPSWVDALPLEHPIKSALFAAIRTGAEGTVHMRDLDACMASVSACGQVESASVSSIDLGSGAVTAAVALPRALFYSTIGEMSGFSIADDGDLMSLLTELSTVKARYDRVAGALKDVEENGYGVVMPTVDELALQEPEIVRRGGRYSVRLKASAPSIHMFKADIETEVSPAVAGEKSSGDIINFLLQEFEGDTGKIWESNIFGKSLHDIAGEGLQAKIKMMPPETQVKLRDTLQRIINDGANGLICIIL